jgi:hypothetical protein
MNATLRALFALGQIVSTPGAIRAVADEGCEPSDLLSRHASGDWGDLSEGDKEENQLSLQEGFRIFSSYVLPRTRVKVWVITEADRSATTLLLPDEY